MAEQKGLRRGQTRDAKIGVIRRTNGASGDTNADHKLPAQPNRIHFMAPIFSECFVYLEEVLPESHVNRGELKLSRRDKGGSYLIG